MLVTLDLTHSRKGITRPFMIPFMTVFVLTVVDSCGWRDFESARPTTLCSPTSTISLLADIGACGLIRDLNLTSPSDYFICFPRLSGGLCGFTRLKSLSQVNHSRICRGSRVVLRVVEPLVRSGEAVEFGCGSPESEVSVLQTDGNFRIGLSCISSVSGQIRPLRYRFPVPR